MPSLAFDDDLTWESSWKPIRGNLSMVIRACPIWPLSFALTRDRLQSDILSTTFSIHLFPVLLRPVLESGNPCQNLAGALVGFIDPALILHSAWCFEHRQHATYSPHKKHSHVGRPRSSNLAGYMLKIGDLCAASFAIFVRRPPANVLPWLSVLTRHGKTQQSSLALRPLFKMAASTWRTNLLLKCNFNSSNVKSKSYWIGSRPQMGFCQPRNWAKYNPSYKGLWTRR